MRQIEWSSSFVYVVNTQWLYSWTEVIFFWLWGKSVASWMIRDNIAREVVYIYRKVLKVAVTHLCPQRCLFITPSGALPPRPNHYCHIISPLCDPFAMQTEAELVSMEMFWMPRAENSSQPQSLQLLRKLNWCKINLCCLCRDTWSYMAVQVLIIMIWTGNCSY